jgi:hypothetical protein
MVEPTLPDLEAQREALYSELVGIGDFRRGSVTTNYRRCGKENCACARPGHPGHGPRHLWTRSAAGGKTKGRQVSEGPDLEKVTREIAAYRRFVSLSQQVVEVNEAICEARPVSPLAGEAPFARSEEKGGFSQPSGERSPPR